MQLFPKISTLSWVGVLGLMVAASGCSKTDTGGGGTFDPDCRSCRKDTETCEFSINCQPGSICNDPNDPLFVSDATQGVCIKVICANNADCASPKVCNLEKICEAPLCQTDADCSGGKVCISGACEARPAASDAKSCEVVSAGGAIKQGEKVRLAAVAKNANGKVLTGIAFTWTSDNMSAAAVAANEATGGASSGTANITAAVEGNAATRCTGSVVLRNFAAVAQGSARVILSGAADGAPISGANVWLTDTATTKLAQTGADGSASFTGVAGAVAQVTAGKAGWQYISAIAPGTNDVVFTMQKRPDTTKAGGFRGSVDLSKTKRADIKLGIAGPSLPANVLDLQLESIIGDFIETRINAPDLGINDQNVDLPGGIMLALGTSVFTDDTMAGNLRCQGTAPKSTEIGCYVARGPVGPAAAWVLAGQLKLSAISPIAGEISGAIGGGGASDINIGSLLTSILPLLRSLNHGINAGISITEHPNVNKRGQSGNCADPNLADYEDKCQADFSKYQKIELAADAELGVLSTVTVPTLPKLPDDKFVQAAIVLGGAIVQGRGLVPLGLSAGVDTTDDRQTPDGRIFGVREPFGPNSDPLMDGEVPLAMAPAHSGIEGSQLLLVAIALDPSSIAGGGGIQLSTVIERVGRVERTSRINGNFLRFPTGTFDVGRGTFTPQAAVAGAQVMRMVLERNNQEWLVYAPAGTSAITLPNVAAARQATLGNGVDVLLQVVNTTASYTELFTFGSGKTADRLSDTTQSFVVQGCGTEATSPCKIQ